MLAALGAHIIDTDLIARDVVAPGEPALQEIAAMFGAEVINPDGTLDRAKVRERIIRDPQMRLELNAISHPRILGIVTDRIGEYRCTGDGMPIIVDVPLLYESGWDRSFIDSILVYAPVPVQVARLMKRDNLDLRTAELTISAQMGIEEKKKRARHIIDNSGTLAETRTQVEKLFTVLLEEMKMRRK
jgi:dephospho-CoA kinase